MALEYKHICRNCWKVIPSSGNLFAGAVYLKDEWLCHYLCEDCYRVKYPHRYEDWLIKKKTARAISMIKKIMRT